MGTAKGDGYTVTPRDLELIVTAINCSKLPFEVNYKDFASRLGYKSDQSAKAAWNTLKKKLDKVAEGAEVVPSLTIQPMQTEKTTTASNVLATSGKGKGKEIEASGPGACASEYSDDDEPPVRKSKKKRNLAQTVDEGGDIAMAESSRAVPTQQTARPYSKAAGKQRTHSKVLSKASDESDPDSTDDAGARSSQSLAEKAKKSLQRLETTANGPKEGAKSNNANATQAPGAMATMMKASSWHRKKGGQSVDGAVASVAETKTSLKRKRADEVDKATVAAAVARERAMRMLGIFGGDDEDDDDVSPYFKKEE